MPIALITNYLADYRLPLYERLARRHELEVLCYGGQAEYVPAWFSDLDRQLAQARFPARRIGGTRAVLGVGGAYDAVIAPYAGGAVLPAAYLGARRHRRPFILWASVWQRPRSPAHTAAWPLLRHIYRRSDAVLAYGEHVKRYVASLRGSEAGVFVAPQSVEPEVFGRPVAAAEAAAFRAQHQLGDGPLVLYVGRLVEAKGVGVLAEAWAQVSEPATLVAIGDGPLAGRLSAAPRARLLGPLPRPGLPVAYAAAELAVLPSIPTPRFVEPWGLVCNEAMYQSRPVVATDAVGAVAGGLVRDGETGRVVPAGDPDALAAAINQLLGDQAQRTRLGEAGRLAMSAYTYEAMTEAFDQALAAAGVR